MSASKAVVYVVEDDPSFSKSLECLIEALGYEVIIFNTAQAFLGQSRIERPACLLLDVQLPGMNGLNLQQALVEKGSSLPIVFLTGHGDIPMSVQTMKKGAVDFLPKPVKAQDLHRAILESLKRDIQNLKVEREAQKSRSLVDTLTPREKEVFRWVITGKLNKQIADALGIAEKTIRIHRGRVMHKTKSTSVAQLISLAKKINIFPAA